MYINKTSYAASRQCTLQYEKVQKTFRPQLAIILRKVLVTVRTQLILANDIFGRR